jgi:leucyl-tRNA---protein transferase
LIRSDWKFLQNFDPMLAQSLSPFSMSPDSLDSYLEKGWFRMGQTIFTTNFLHFKDKLYSAVWLRIDLSRFVPNSTQKKLYKQNARFRTAIGPAIFTEEKEVLYRKYRQSISFDASSSIHQLMFGSMSFNIYNTFEVCIYDEEKLIGCGFFDIGNKSSAGITSFYDPEYKRSSLGKYLIYMKIDHCKSLGLRYFYPGYFVPGYAHFDYKLTLTRSGLEYLDLGSSKWCEIESFSYSRPPLQVMQEHIQKLSAGLAGKVHSWRTWTYAYFDANILIDLETAHFLDYPVFIASAVEEEIRHVVVYNVVSGKFECLQCQGFQLSNTLKAENLLSGFLLKKEQVVFSSDKVEETVEFLTNELFKPGDRIKKEPA